MSEIKVGDVVVPKGGGPKMGVHESYEDNVLCRWFMGQEGSWMGPFTQLFPKNLLESVDEAQQAGAA